jgi:PAS domain-containing protein
MTALQIGYVFLISGLTVTVALLVIARRGPGAMPPVSVPSNPVAFLFDDTRLLHATPLAQTLIHDAQGASDWAKFRNILSNRFPLIPSHLDRSGVSQFEIEASDPNDSAVLRIERMGQKTRVELIETDTDVLRDPSNVARSMRILFDRVNEVCRTSPFPMWMVDDNGSVSWSNPAYDALARDCQQPEEESHKPVLAPSKVLGDAAHSRLSTAAGEDGRHSWFEVKSTSVDSGTIFHASNIDALVEAEIAQKNFVQTLAKTFAQISTGLAIFDRNRQLVLFNPALIELTGLQAEFLSARPQVTSFLDAIRNNRKMPEPKNYKSWREEVTRIIDAAEGGDFEEIWSLDSGRTHKVIGRPHPDGAVAFLIEDISTEVSQTRSFRSKLKESTSVLEAFSEAIVVFSASGVLTYCNAAYKELWQTDPDSSFADVTILDSMRIWQDQILPNPALGETRDFVMKKTERAAWDATLLQENGTRIVMRVAPIESAATAIRFDLMPATVEPAGTASG